MPDTLKPPAPPMQSPQTSARTLALRVHRDGIRHDPRGWLQGTWWWLTGKKLRARNRFSALNGKSPHAYALWMAQTEPALLAQLPQTMPAKAPSILIVIDTGRGAEGLAETMASVRASDPLARIARAGDAVEAPGWVLPLRAGDLLAPMALATYAEAALSHPGSAAIYADDDLIGADGQRQSPHFKPDWNPALHRHHDYLSHAALLRFAGPLPSTPDWARQIAEQALTEGAAPVHLPHVLHHRRIRPEPVLPPPPEPLPDAALPHVTVLVPTRDRLDLLRTCLEGLDRTDYPAFDCIVIDNDSRDPETLAFLAALPRDRYCVLRYGGSFNFSAMNNAGTQIAGGDLLCFLNNDIEIIEGSWLRALVANAVQPGFGAVGAKLLYPDGAIQHAGVVTGVGGGAAHAHRFQRDDEAGYYHRAHLPQQVTAVTAACMLVARDKFTAVGGFDAENFPVAFNDVDLCLKLNARGWQCFYEPRAVLVHHESKSRGKDSAVANRERFAGELAALKRIWGTDLTRDPFHHPQLSPFSDTFVVAI